MTGKSYDFSLEDFDTEKPYKYLFDIRSQFERQQEIKFLGEYAKSIGYKGFGKMWQSYLSDKKTAKNKLPEPENISDTSWQQQEYKTGKWTVNDNGIFDINGEPVSATPLVPVRLIRNIDTNELMVVLQWTTKNSQKQQEVPMKTLSTARTITDLATIGISVVSGDRAQKLAEYIRDMLDLNADIIPESLSVTHMGWNSYGFAPYTDKVTFDGNRSFGAAFDSIVNPRGDLETWKKEAAACCGYSLAAQIVLGASFAAPLVEPLEVLPFFVHLWGMDSGTGKTVAQMLAASVWANPDPGGAYITTFQSTNVGTEVLAGFLHSLPVVIDELQLARKDGTGKQNFDVYRLASGVGKTRSNKNLGIQPQNTWKTCFITSGETPIVSENDGAGAVNRVIEIECRANEKVIEDGHKTAGILRENYGLAGREYINRIVSGDDYKKKMLALYDDFFLSLLKYDTTEKQAMAAATILTGYLYAKLTLLPDIPDLSARQMSEYLKRTSEVSAMDRGYEHMCSWVSSNAALFDDGNRNGCYGFLEVEGGVVTKADVIRNAWDEECEKVGISSKALLSHLKSRNLIETRGDNRGFMMRKRVNGIPSDVVVLRLLEDVN